LKQINKKNKQKQKGKSTIIGIKHSISKNKERLEVLLRKMIKIMKMGTLISSKHELINVEFL